MVSDERGDQTLLNVAADRLPDGKPIYETLWLETTPRGTYRLVKTPLVAQGAAVGDELEVDSVKKTFEVVQHGGNLTVQLFMDPQLTDDVFQELQPKVQRLGGGLDAHTSSIAGFYVPVRAGFPAVEQVFNEFVAAHPGAEWMFANVYDEDGKQLWWW